MLQNNVEIEYNHNEYKFGTAVLEDEICTHIRGGIMSDVHKTYNKKMYNKKRKYMSDYPVYTKGGGSVAKMESYRKKTSHRKSLSSTVVLLVFFVFVFFNLIRSFIFYVNKPDIPTDVVLMGSVDYPEIYSGIIIRDEKVYTSDTGGTVSYNVSEYEKVKRNAVVCSISNEQYVAMIESEKSILEKSILDMQQRRIDISEYSVEAAIVNKQIKNMIDKRSFNFVDGGISTLYSLKENVEINMNIRNQMLFSDTSGSVREKAKEKEAYEKELSENITFMRTDETGLVAWTVDGFEEKMNFSNMNELIPEQTRMKIDFDKIITSKDINPGDTVFKIIKSNEWYIACYLPSEKSHSWTENSFRTIYIEMQDAYVPLDVSISSIKKGDKENFVIFKATKNVLDFINMRSVNIKTSDSVRKGLKIPNSSVVDKTLLKIPNHFIYDADDSNKDKVSNTDAKMVYKKNGEVIEQIIIYPQDSDEGYSYVLQDFNILKLGDTLSKKDVNDVFVLDEILSVKGVYVTNDGIAKFRRIYTEDVILDNTGYTILDNKTNKLKVYDRIATNARHIVDGQRIY